MPRAERVDAHQAEARRRDVEKREQSDDELLVAGERGGTLGVALKTSISARARHGLCELARPRPSRHSSLNPPTGVPRRLHDRQIVLFAFRLAHDERERGLVAGDVDVR